MAAFALSVVTHGAAVARSSGGTVAKIRDAPLCTLLSSSSTRYSDAPRVVEALYLSARTRSSVPDHSANWDRKESHSHQVVSTLVPNQDRPQQESCHKPLLPAACWGFRHAHWEKRLSAPHETSPACRAPKQVARV